MSQLLEGSAAKKNIAVLDGVRAVACLSVIVFHVSYVFHLEHLPTIGLLLPSVFMTGDTGVTLFFVLSGFLLFMPYAKSLLFDQSWPSLRHFYLRRALRILPGYYLALFLLIAFAHREFLRPDHWKALLLFLTLFMDSSTHTYKQINGPFWTLAVEWQFYLLLPLLALGMRALVQRGSLGRRVAWLAVCLLALAAWGVFSRWLGIYLNLHPNALSHVPHLLVRVPYFFLIGAPGDGLHGKFLEDFAMGMTAGACFVLARNLPPDSSYTRVLRRLSPWLWGGSILWLFALALWKFQLGNLLAGDKWGHLLFYGYYTWSELFFSLGYSCLVIAVLFGSQGFQRMFSWSPLRWIGLISYSLYIWHLPLLDFFTRQVLTHVTITRFSQGYALGWLWILCAVLPFALVFFLTVERPWMLLSDRWLNGKRKGEAEISSRRSRGS